MIQRDYVLRMIAEFAQALSRIQALKQHQLWTQATAELQDHLQRLLGASAEELERETDTELLARIVQGEATQVVRNKAAMVTSLLKEAGDVAIATGEEAKGRALHIKGLDLLLSVLAEDDSWGWPEFAPKVEMFLLALSDASLPRITRARLMQHYERRGEFAKAEDAFFALLESEPEAREILEFGAGFYERLGRHSDAALAAGNLPRAELEAGLAELRRR